MSGERFAYASPYKYVRRTTVSFNPWNDDTTSWADHWVRCTQCYSAQVRSPRNATGRCEWCGGAAHQLGTDRFRFGRESDEIRRRGWT
jgi:hypothetical protein